MTESRSPCSVCDDVYYVTRPGTRWAQASLCQACSVPCPACGGAERVIERRPDGRTWVTPCGRCGPLRRRIARFNAAHLPAAYYNKSVEAFEAQNKEQNAVKRQMLRFQSRGEAGDSGVLIVGNPGVGKTHLMCGILRFLILERGMVCRYVDSFQLLQELKATYEAGTGSAALMEEVSSVPVLGIDELGKTKPAGWQHEVLDQIISRRYDQGLTTFVTSNYGMRRKASAQQSGRIGELARRETLEERVGARIYSRLMEMCKPYKLTGRDRRLGN